MLNGCHQNRFGLVMKKTEWLLQFRVYFILSMNLKGALCSFPLNKQKLCCVFVTETHYMYNEDLANMLHCMHNAVSNIIHNCIFFTSLSS